MTQNDAVVPDLQSMMLPCLEVLVDGKELSNTELHSAIADKIGLDANQRNLRHEKTGNLIYKTNIQFATSYLVIAGLLQRPRRACFQITESGKDLLAKKPGNINTRFLIDHYPAFAERQKKWGKNTETNHLKTSDSGSELLVETPPETIIEQAHSILCEDLANELLDTVKKSHWTFFERLVVDLLIAMGYGGTRQDAASVVGKSGDNGIDGVIKEDKLGLDVVYIQAKRYSEPITISQVRDFAGALLYKKARKGVFITTSSFPKSAEDFVATIEQKIVLIDGQKLAKYMIEHNIGVTTKVNYEVKRIDNDYFEEDE